MEKFIITKEFVKKIRRFNLVGRTLEFKIKPIPECEEPIQWMKEAVNQVVEKATEGLTAGDQVGFSFCSKDLKRGNGWIRFRPVEEITYDSVWDFISSVYQSNSTGLSTSTFCLGVTSVRTPAGKGRGKNYNSFHEECETRRGIIVIKNKDNMCLPRALVMAIACVNKDPDRSKVRKDTLKLQTKRALQLCLDSGVIIPEVGCGIIELQKFQEHLKNYKIVVYKYGSKGRDIMFDGFVEGSSLHLLYHKGHYNVITSLTAAFGCPYFCERCHAPYYAKDSHRCEGTCACCQQAPQCQQQPNIVCEVCNRKFRGQQCLENHTKTGVCEKIQLCSVCLKTVKSDRQHACGEVYCKICSAHVTENHLCYMKCDSGKPKIKDVLFIFYDLETRQEKMLDNSDYLHEPNLCVSTSRCDECINEDELYFCQKCGYRQVLFKDSVVNNFMKYVLEIRKKKFKRVVVIAHNGQAFDHQFCLNYILTKTDLKPELIMKGTKIMSMVVGNVQFLDSLNYFPMALSKLPKAFGLEKCFRKGYFPHLFNTAVNKNYVGSLPLPEFYEPDNMNKCDREMFFTWYNEHKQDKFDMQRDLVDYCISDVEILTAACLKFRRQLLETSGVCPFTEACTIASTCNKIYRRNFLKPNTIGIIPKGGYRWRDNQSKIAIQWLVWEEKQRQINIVHAAKQHEAKIHGRKVDGFCSETKQVFEFYGCYYHGCFNCFKYGRDTPLHDDPSETLNTRHEGTIAKAQELAKLGYTLIEMWECKFRRNIIENEELQLYISQHPLVNQTPLNPRDAFYGGRTGNTFEYYKAGEREKIKYVDVCSLYPWVCKYGKFPIAHPQVYVGRECEQFDLRIMNGIIKCTILPPQDLYHPILPLKMNDKLMFVLCYTCGREMSEDECNHDKQERALTGTWVIDEVLKAVERGYQILKIYEVWSYQVDQFNKAENSGGLFRELMDKFLKIKQQATGWPKSCVSETDRNKYIDDFLNKEGIKMEHAEILDNPGLRSMAKLILNSFWGKLGQRENQPKTTIVNDPGEFFGMLSNSGIIVNHVLPVNENTVIVNWQYKEEAYDILPTVNVAIAAFVTAQARLKLYSYLEKLGNRVLYYDTDSIIYVSRPGEYDVPTGKFIGDMTDELEVYGSGSYITEFVSGGPKNYAYKVFSTDEQRDRFLCKVKGISLNYSADKLVNFESIKKMVLTPSEPLFIISKNIRRTKEHEVVTRMETKMYKTNSTKRKFFDNHTSLPFGYKKLKIF